MKTLILMRHGKSSWKHLELSDHDRPLKKRGKRDAPRMGELLKEKDLVPQRILSSTAVRARRTAEMVAEECGFEGDIDYLRSFYHAELLEYFEVLQELPDEVERVLVIGHNPSLEGLLQILSDEIEALPTAAVAQIELKIKSWSEIDDDGYGKLVNLWYPRRLED